MNFFSDNESCFSIPGDDPDKSLLEEFERDSRSYPYKRYNSNFHTRYPALDGLNWWWYSHKRAPGSEFLGKRAPGSEFLGKRAPGSEFLGKRAPGSEFLGKRAPGSEFLGKRAPGSEFLGKRAPGSEFLGKRAPGSEFLGKRAPGSEFLGKRRPADDDQNADYADLYHVKRSLEQMFPNQQNSGRSHFMELNHLE